MYFSITKLRAAFNPGGGARALLISSLIFGIAFGCYNGVLNNYLSEELQMDERGRGVLEFFREMPGLLLVVILALFHRMSQWRIYRMGFLVCALGVAAMTLTRSQVLITLFIMLWSTGEHILMPVRQSITLHAAKKGKTGTAMGFVAGAGYAGNMMGGIMVALFFYICAVKFHTASNATLFTIVWVAVIFLAIASFFCAGSKQIKELNTPVKRPRIYFNKKFNKFYILEIFYGARKQVFITFAPYVLIRVYGMDTSVVALLLGLSAGINIFCGPLIGKLTDKVGYRNIMIYDTVFLFFVCIVYGFAHDIFPMAIAGVAVCINYLLDAVISTASMASGIYVREISDSTEEVTATLTTGISVNHLVSILIALLGGVIWYNFGVGMLFCLSAAMALGNTAFAITIPRSGEKTENKSINA